MLTSIFSHISLLVDGLFLLTADSRIMTLHWHAKLPEEPHLLFCFCIWFFLNITLTEHATISSPNYWQLHHQSKYRCHFTQCFYWNCLQLSSLCDCYLDPKSRSHGPAQHTYTCHCACYDAKCLNISSSTPANHLLLFSFILSHIYTLPNIWLSTSTDKTADPRWIHLTGLESLLWLIFQMLAPCPT